MVSEEPVSEIPRGTRTLILLRHGVAEESSPDKDDVSRSLTEGGHEKMRENARGLKRLFPRVGVICSSPLVRALQTALWVAKAYGEEVPVETWDSLRPEADRETLRRALDALPQRRVLLVSHEPVLTGLAASLVRSFPPGLELRKGGSYVLRAERPGGLFELYALLPPAVLREAARR